MVVSLWQHVEYLFLLLVKGVYDTVWHNGLWYKLWDMGVKGKMWRVIRKMYEGYKSMVLLDGKKSEEFNVKQGVAQGCNLSPILFFVFINDLLKEVEEAELGIQLNSGNRISSCCLQMILLMLVILRKICKSL